MPQPRTHQTLRLTRANAFHVVDKRRRFKCTVNALLNAALAIGFAMMTKRPRTATVRLITAYQLRHLRLPDRTNRGR
jgi:hypothetical protein